MKTALIFVSGGVGRRMGQSSPKQYLTIHGKAIALYSFEQFLKHPNIDEIVVVAEPKWHSLFERAAGMRPILFAEPGERRQDSVENGLNALTDEERIVMVHDSARPCITQELIERVREGAIESEVCSCAVKITCTVKEADATKTVQRTVPRENLYEIQTPQALKYSVMKRAFAHVNETGVDVTDDLSLAEALGLKPILVEGLKRNLKVTYPEDLQIAKSYLS